MGISDLIPWGRRDGRAKRGVGELREVRSNLNSIFEGLERMLAWQPGSAEIESIEGGRVPRIEVVEDTSTITVKAEVPGLTEKEISLSLADDHLTISGEKRSEQIGAQTGVRYSEVSYGSFSRTVPLPGRVDAKAPVEATLKNGLLTVVMKRLNGASEGRKAIPVKAA